jgi:hypothetical protein
MSNSTASNQSQSDIDPAFGLIHGLTEHLIPLFPISAVDVPLARQMALSAIEAYEPESRADYVNVARTLAFSMSALSLLGQAAAQDMTMPEKLRVFGRASALSRSADDTERTMMQRRHYQRAIPRAEQPAEMSSRHEAPTPEPDMDEAEAQASVAEAMRIYATCASAGVATAQATPTPLSETAAPKSTPTLVSLGRPPLTAPTAAIRYNDPRPDGSHPRVSPHKQELLGNSAIQRVVEQSAALNPA